MAKSNEQPRQIISTNCRAKPAVCLVLCCLVSTLSSQMLLLSCFAESCQRHSRGAGLRTSMKVLQRSRNNQQVRAQHRLERRLKFEETKSFSTGHDPQHLLMRLELMSKGQLKGFAPTVLESYLDQHGRSKDLAFEYAMRGEARLGRTDGIEEVLSRGNSEGMTKARLLDFAVEELSKCGFFSTVEHYFLLLRPSQKRLDHLFHAAIKKKNISAAERVLRHMDEEGFVVDKVHFEQLLQASVRAEGVWKAERHVRKMVSRRLEPTERIYGTLLDAYGSKGNVTACMRLLRGMKEHHLQPQNMHYGQVFKAAAKVSESQDHSFCLEQVLRTMMAERLRLNDANRADLLRAVGEPRYKEICRSCDLRSNVKRRKKTKELEK
ncbi:unnamed protein product [Durusdinium trenchii]|uniref:Pentatricopeptide repeat-containing protein n=1 Tax=Durusdinium trenchii TaxID=1381693 RepID=A0ABP0M774_9DINO